MGKELTPEEQFLKDKIHEDADLGVLDWDTWAELIKEYSELHLKSFLEFCSDNYNIDIPDRVIQNFKQSI